MVQADIFNESRGVMTIPVAVQFKMRVCSPSAVEIAGSNPSEVLHFRRFCFLCVVYVVHSTESRLVVQSSPKASERARARAYFRVSNSALSTSITLNRTDNLHTNLILGRVRVTFVAAEKQWALHIPKCNRIL
jgi:hypothetical protein